MPNRRFVQKTSPRSQKYIALAGTIIALVLLILPVQSCANPDNKSNDDEGGQISANSSSSTISLLLAGDSVIHESVYKDAENADGTYDFAKQLDTVTEITHDYDLAFYNQESILGGPDLGLSGYPTFNAPQEFGDYMIGKGFNLVSTANNHSLDRGTNGIQASRKFWNTQLGVLTDGTNASADEQNAIPTKEIKGIKIAFVAYCENTNGISADYGWEVNYSYTDEEKMLERIKTAKSTNDVVIVSVHWGDEYSKDVNARQTSLAKKIVEAGGDIIVGNHPHVVQPFQWIDGKPVFYAMGNLISSQAAQENLVGMMAEITIKKDTSGNISFDNVKADLTYTLMDGSYPNLRTNIEVKPLKNISDEEISSQGCTKETNSATDLYNETVSRLKSLDDNITIGGIWDD